MSTQTTTPEPVKELWTWTFYPRGLAGVSNTLDCTAADREAAHASALRWVRKENRRRKAANITRLKEPSLYDMKREADRFAK